MADATKKVDVTVQATVEAMISLNIVWQESHWPETPVRVGAGSIKPAFRIDDGNHPVLMKCELLVVGGKPARAVIEEVVTERARQQLATGTHGFSIFGKPVRAGQLLHDGDRVELLGPVTADPKSDRRKRVAEQRQQLARSMWNK
ncbi:MAG: RnfH family protein [Burkholderiaceae bacterium]